MKVRKLRKERERSLSTAMSTAGQTMTETEKSSDFGKILACSDGVPLTAAGSHLYSAVTQTSKVLEQLSAR